MKDLSGGQKRRLQLLLILLSEPNVLILDEPTNDLDTDMLAAIEDLLDSWPGTLLVVSHDRYLIERVTDQQYAILDGHLRDLPRGVDQYLELRRATDAAAARVRRATRRVPWRRVARGGRRRRWTGGTVGARRTMARVRAPEVAASAPHRRGAPHRREGALVDRPRLEKLQAQIAAQHEKLAQHDQGDYVGLGALGDELQRAGGVGVRPRDPLARGVGGARGLSGAPGPRRRGARRAAWAR